MKRTKPVTQTPAPKLFIKDLERPAMAGLATTLAIGEECGKGCFKGEVTTLAYGEESDSA